MILVVVVAVMPGSWLSWRVFRDTLDLSNDHCRLDVGTPGTAEHQQSEMVLDVGFLEIFAHVFFIFHFRHSRWTLSRTNSEMNAEPLNEIK